MNFTQQKCKQKDLNLAVQYFFHQKKMKNKQNSWHNIIKGCPLLKYKYTVRYKKIQTSEEGLITCK